MSVAVAVDPSKFAFDLLKKRLEKMGNMGILLEGHTHSVVCEYDPQTRTMTHEPGYSDEGVSQTCSPMRLMFSRSSNYFPEMLVLFGEEEKEGSPDVEYLKFCIDNFSAMNPEYSADKYEVKIIAAPAKWALDLANKLLSGYDFPEMGKFLAIPKHKTVSYYLVCPAVKAWVPVGVGDAPPKMVPVMQLRKAVKEHRCRVYENEGKQYPLLATYANGPIEVDGFLVEPIVGTTAYFQSITVGDGKKKSEIESVESLPPNIRGKMIQRLRTAQEDFFVAR